MFHIYLCDNIRACFFYIIIRIIRVDMVTSIFFFLVILHLLSLIGIMLQYSTVYVQVYCVYTKCTKSTKTFQASQISAFHLAAFLTLAQPTNLSLLSLSSFYLYFINLCFVVKCQMDPPLLLLL